MKPIEITISEVDREGAGSYHNCQHCIMATALMNRGYNVRSVSWGFARIGRNEDKWYFDGVLVSRHLDHNDSLYLGYLGYRPSIVGTKITLYKEAEEGPGYLAAKAAAENEEANPEVPTEALAPAIS